jgi:hypothetical protein
LPCFIECNFGEVQRHSDLQLVCIVILASNKYGWFQSPISHSAQKGHSAAEGAINCWGFDPSPVKSKIMSYTSEQKAFIGLTTPHNMNTKEMPSTGKRHEGPNVTLPEEVLSAVNFGKTVTNVLPDVSDLTKWDGPRGKDPDLLVDPFVAQIPQSGGSPRTEILRRTGKITAERRTYWIMRKADELEGALETLNDGVRHGLGCIKRGNIRAARSVRRSLISLGEQITQLTEQLGYLKIERLACMRVQILAAQDSYERFIAELRTRVPESRSVSLGTSGPLTELDSTAIKFGDLEIVRRLHEFDPTYNATAESLENLSFNVHEDDFCDVEDSTKGQGFKLMSNADKNINENVALGSHQLRLLDTVVPVSASSMVSSWLSGKGSVSVNVGDGGTGRRCGREGAVESVFALRDHTKSKVVKLGRVLSHLEALVSGQCAKGDRVKGRG